MRRYGVSAATAVWSLHPSLWATQFHRRVRADRSRADAATEPSSGRRMRAAPSIQETATSFLDWRRATVWHGTGRQHVVSLRFFDEPVRIAQTGSWAVSRPRSCATDRDEAIFAVPDRGLADSAPYASGDRTFWSPDRGHPRKPAESLGQMRLLHATGRAGASHLGLHSTVPVSLRKLFVHRQQRRRQASHRGAFSQRRLPNPSQRRFFQRISSRLASALVVHPGA